MIVDLIRHDLSRLCSGTIIKFSARFFSERRIAQSDPVGIGGLQTLSHLCSRHSKSDIQPSASCVPTADSLKQTNVKVPKLFAIETYETVHQLVSTITAQLPADDSASIFNLLRVGSTGLCYVSFTFHVVCDTTIASLFGSHSLIEHISSGLDDGSAKEAVSRNA